MKPKENIKYLQASGYYRTMKILKVMNIAMAIMLIAFFGWLFFRWVMK